MLHTAVAYLISSKKSQVKTESISHQEMLFFFFSLMFSAKLMVKYELVFKF